MFEYLESISITEGEQIKKTIQALFRQTCILQVKYDPCPAQTFYRRLSFGTWM